MSFRASTLMIFYIVFDASDFAAILPPLCRHSCQVFLELGQLCRAPGARESFTSPLSPAGIGGAGLAPLAVLAKQQGWHVTGSDVENNARVREMRRLGIEIWVGHSKSHLYR